MNGGRFSLSAAGLFLTGGLSHESLRQELRGIPALSPMWHHGNGGAYTQAGNTRAAACRQTGPLFYVLDV